ncbi:MAG: glucuronate isomerase, partial [Flavisolibacter sp.]
MKKFLDENFLLQNKTSQKLFHDYAKDMPVIDYHCHLPPDQIANDINFENLTQVWLYGDHYKWRAMRANGVDESYITGNRSDLEKFLKWGETVPYTLRNPLYHWTHLELQRYFDVNKILDGDSAQKIYDKCTAKLQTKNYSVRNLLRKMNVKVVCTTDDPTDSLEHHQKIKDDGFEVKILPAYRPDKAMNVDDAETFNNYVSKLETVSNTNIGSYTKFLDALKVRHDFFATMGCSVSDHGLEQIYAEEYTESQIENIFNKV